MCAAQTADRRRVWCLHAVIVSLFSWHQSRQPWHPCFASKSVHDVYASHFEFRKKNKSVSFQWKASLMSRAPPIVTVANLFVSTTSSAPSSGSSISSHYHSLPLHDNSEGGKATTGSLHRCCLVIVALFDRAKLCAGDVEKPFQAEKFGFWPSITGETWTASNGGAKNRKEWSKEKGRTALQVVVAKPVKGLWNYSQACNLVEFSSSLSSNGTNR